MKKSDVAFLILFPIFCFGFLYTKTAIADNFAYSSQYQGSKPRAKNVKTDVTNFNGALDSTHVDVQLALDALDEFVGAAGPAGNDQEFQYNNGGAMTGSTGFEWVDPVAASGCQGTTMTANTNALDAGDQYLVHIVKNTYDQGLSGIYAFNDDASASIQTVTTGSALGSTNVVLATPDLIIGSDLISLLDSGISTTALVGINKITPAHALDIGGVSNIQIPDVTAGSGATQGIIYTDVSGTPTPYIHSAGTDSFYAGVDAGGTLSTSINNVGIGPNALGDLDDGTSNTAIGMEAGLNVVDGDGNTFVGKGADVEDVAADANTQFSTAIGYNAKVSADNTMVLGTASTKLVMGDSEAPAGVSYYFNRSTGSLQAQFNATIDTSNQIKQTRGTQQTYFGPSATNEFHIYSGVTDAGATPSSTSMPIVFFPGSSENFRMTNGGVFGIGGTTDLTYGVDFSYTSLRSVGVERTTASNTEGYDLSLVGGGATSGATDKNGGDLVLKSGISTGTGASEIYFYTAQAGATGTTDRTPALRASLDGDGKLEVNSGKASSGNTASVGGSSSIQVGTVGNINAGEDDLKSYTLPANTLGTNGDTIKVEGWGFFADNANTKLVKFYFDGTPVAFSVAGTAGAASVWYMKAIIIRDSSTTWKGMAYLWADPAVAPQPIYINTLSASATFSNSIIIKMTGEATTTNDIQQQSMIVEWLPNN